MSRVGDVILDPPIIVWQETYNLSLCDWYMRIMPLPLLCFPEILNTNVHFSRRVYVDCDKKIKSFSYCKLPKP